MDQEPLRWGPTDMKSKEAIEIPLEEFSRCRDEIDALWIAYRYRRETPPGYRDMAADLRRHGLDISSGRLNLILNRGGSTGRAANPPFGFWDALQAYTNSDFHEKYLKYRRLHRQDWRQQRKAELLAELEEIERVEQAPGLRRAS